MQDKWFMQQPEWHALSAADQPYVESALRTDESNYNDDVSTRVCLCVCAPVCGG